MKRETPNKDTTTSKSQYAILKESMRSGVKAPQGKEPVKVSPVPVYPEKELINQKIKNPFSQTTQYISERAKIKDEQESIISKQKRMADEVIKSQREYISSPLYTMRASKFGDAKIRQQQALQALQGINILYNKIRNETNAPKNQVELDIDADRLNMAHEFAHLTGARPGRTGVAIKLTPAEEQEIQKRNIKLNQITSKYKIPYKDVEINRYNEHDIAPYENRADIELLRQALYQNKITEKYGENIDGNKLLKLLKVKGMKENKFIKRLFGKDGNFKAKDVIELHNMLASNRMTDNQNIA
jgi:hypothetical protein